MVGLYAAAPIVGGLAAYLIPLDLRERLRRWRKR
jgi:hypothetical protein